MGEKILLDLAGKTAVGEVGLVPGYAKTDVRSGIDRYAENDRITRVRWVFDDGTTSSSVQRRPAGPRCSRCGSRGRRRRPSSCEILAVAGDRNTIAVSELRLGAVAR